MRPEHTPQGDPCEKCGLAAARHRKRSRAAFFRTYNAKAGRRESAQPRGPKKPAPVIAIDGEGYTLADGSHRYTYLAACGEAGLVSELYNPKGVTAEEVFAFMLSLPKGALLVGYALGYDKTKWLESWPDKQVWLALRPEERQSDGGPLPVKWKGWRVNIVSTRTTIGKRGEKPCTVWDLFKFFQSSFVKAIGKWDVGTKAERELIEKEKARRGSFKGITARERDYCQLECRLLAVLARRLLDAHKDLGLTLKSYYGPGSSAAIVLGEHGDQRARFPAEMGLPVMAAYFGGRFECSRVGPVYPLPEHSRLFAYDIASAYPDAMTRVPCLLHGRWVKRKGEPRPERLSLVRFRTEPHKDACTAWGPLPHRMPDGNILYPVRSAGGWCWLPEYEAARAIHPGVSALECWTFEPSCDHVPPYAERIRELYARRIELGKTTKGIVLKLILNSLYGKSAQRVGKGKYRCMIRAGLITSETRAKLLWALALAKDPWNVLELATDSILSLEPLPIARKDLGGWEAKPWEGGAFLMRPGLRFALDSDEHTAARGVGVRVLDRNRARIVRQWEKRPLDPVVVQTPSFFHGARLEIRKHAGKYTRSELYGRWTDEEKRLSYAATPKRFAIAPDYKLTAWALPMGEAFASVAYGSAAQSPIGDELDEYREREEDQPDADMLALL